MPCRMQATRDVDNPVSKIVYYSTWNFQLTVINYCQIFLKIHKPDDSMFL